MAIYYRNKDVTKEKKKVTGCMRYEEEEHIQVHMRKGKYSRDEKKGLELRKRRRRNDRRKRVKGRRSGELVERKEVSRRLRP